MIISIYWWEGNHSGKRWGIYVLCTAYRPCPRIRLHHWKMFLPNYIQCSYCPSCWLEGSEAIIVIVLVFTIISSLIKTHHIRRHSHNYSKGHASMHSLWGSILSIIFINMATSMLIIIGLHALHVITYMKIPLSWSVWLHTAVHFLYITLPTYVYTPHHTRNTCCH